MSPWWLVVLAVAVLVGVRVAWGWKRRTENLLALAGNVARLRGTAEIFPRYRPVEDPAWEESPTRELHQAFTLLLQEAELDPAGDYEEVLPDGTVTGVMRWVLGREGDVCGWIAVPPGPLPVLQLFSEVPPDRYLVSAFAAPEIRLAQPDTIETHYHPWPEELPEAVQAHRARVEELSATVERSPFRVRTAEDAMALVGRIHESRTAWRKTLPPDALLEADLHTILGPQYEELGEPVRTLLEEP